MTEPVPKPTESVFIFLPDQFAIIEENDSVSHTVGLFWIGQQQSGQKGTCNGRTFLCHFQPLRDNKDIALFPLRNFPRLRSL